MLIPSLINIPVIGGQAFSAQGKQYFVLPISGSDSNPGNNIARPLKTLKAALALCTENQNDVVFLVAEGSTAATTSDYLATNLDWNKNLVHLIGIGTGTAIGQRARICNTGVFTTPLFTVSASGCIFSNLLFFFGDVAATTTVSIGALLVTGQRNLFYNCQISGIGHDDMDVSGAYSLSIAGGAENTFDGCYIGLDTIARGTATNTEIVFSSHATRNLFKNCIIATYAEAAGHTFITAAAGSLDRFAMFRNCMFWNPINSAATSITEAFSVTAPTGGTIIVDNCSLIGAGLWETSAGASTEVQMVGVAKLATQTGGIGFATA